MSAVDRVARAIADHLPVFSASREQINSSARAAIAAIRPMDAATERAVALASCSRTDRISGRCQCSFLKMEDDCLARARQTVEALVKAMEDGK